MWVKCIAQNLRDWAVWPILHAVWRVDVGIYMFDQDVRYQNGGNTEDCTDGASWGPGRHEDQERAAVALPGTEVILLKYSIAGLGDVVCLARPYKKSGFRISLWTVD